MLMPSERQVHAETATVVATSPGAAMLSPHNPPQGGLRGSTGDGCDSGGESSVEAADREVTMRTEQLLSKNVQAGRVVVFAGDATGALLVSQEFGERRPQHGITKVGYDWLFHARSSLCVVFICRDAALECRFRMEVPMSDRNDVTRQCRWCFGLCLI